MYTIKDLYDLDHTLAKDYLLQFTYPWEALKGIKDFILRLGPTLGDDYEEISEHVWVHKTAKVFPSAYLGAPCIIGPETEVRHCAFIRSSALVGANCVVGNSVELKNVILFDHVQTPHYNYVGDSILGYYSHMGAGSITSNVKSAPPTSNRTRSSSSSTTAPSRSRPASRNSARCWAITSKSAATACAIPAPSSAVTAISIPPPAYAASSLKTAFSRTTA